MKKTYVKPCVAVETFQLNAAVAAACSQENKLPLNYSMDTCTLQEEAPGLNYFGNICIHDIKVEGDGNDLICYHGPTPATAVAMNS